MMGLSIKPAAEFSLPDLAALFNHAFEGYIGGDVHLDRDNLLTILTRDNTDLLLSRVLIHNNTPQGFILIARQGWTSRIAAMGIIPEAKGQGRGKWFLNQVIDESRARGEKALVLEAFEQNTPAVELYKRVGFTVVRRLIGYDAEAIQGVSSPDLTEIDPLDMAKQIMQHGVSDLPWQVSATTIARAGAPNRAYRLGHAYALITNPNAEVVVIRALLVEPDFRRQGQATRLIQALAAASPAKKWTVGQMCPEEYGCVYSPKLGFITKALNQVQMHLDL